MVIQDPTLAAPIRFAAEAIPSQQFALGLDDALLIVFMFPIVRFILTRVGLPWLYEAGRYSELWRLRFHRWLDDEYEHQGFDPIAAEAAGEALRRELERTTDVSARASWERLRALMGDGPSTDAG